MTAATAPLNTQMEEIGAGDAAYPMVDNIVIYKGTMVALTNAGLARPAANTAGMIVVGIALDTVDNTVTGHAAGAWPPAPNNWIRVRQGVNARLNASGSPAQANLDQTLYVVDDNTVQLTPTSSGVAAGTFDKRESASIAWVRVGAPSAQAASAMFAGVTDAFAVAPASELLPIPVVNIAYASPIVPPSAPANQACLRATCSTAGATAVVQCDLTDLLSRIAAGKGLTVTGIIVHWTLTTQPLTAGPSCIVDTATYPAAAAAAAAVAIGTLAGGAITPVPASTQTAVPTAGQFYATQFNLGTPLALNSPLIDAYAEVSFPCTNGSVVYVARIGVLYNYAPF